MSETPTRTLPKLLAVLALVAGAAVGCADEPVSRPRPVATAAPVIGLATVLEAVRKAPAIRALPPGLAPKLAAADDLGFDNSRCEAGPAADRKDDPCVFGDLASAYRVVLYGDSHAGMWLPAMMTIAERRHWRLEFYGKPGCPAPDLTFWNQRENRPFVECDRFRAFVLDRIQTDPPDLTVVTSDSFARMLDRDVPVNPAQWRAGLQKTLTTIRPVLNRVVVLGETPVLDDSAPDCLARHAANITACFTTQAKATARIYNEADQAAARATGAGYVSVLPWLCSAVCTPVIGNTAVYRNRFHLSATYVRMLNGVLAEALRKAVATDGMP